MNIECNRVTVFRKKIVCNVEIKNVSEYRSSITSEENWKKYKKAKKWQIISLLWNLKNCKNRLI